MPRKLGLEPIHKFICQFSRDRVDGSHLPHIHAPCSQAALENLGTHGAAPLVDAGHLCFPDVPSNAIVPSDTYFHEVYSMTDALATSFRL